MIFTLQSNYSKGIEPSVLSRLNLALFMGYINRQKTFDVWKIRKSIMLHRCNHKGLVYGMPWANFELSNHFFFIIALVTAECYNKFIFNFVSQLNKLEQWCYFQQDGAHTYSSQSMMALLNEFLKTVLFLRVGGQQRIQRLDTAWFFFL